MMAPTKYYWYDNSVSINYCHHCGKKIEPSFAYCPGCGQYIYRWKRQGYNPHNPPVDYVISTKKENLPYCVSLWESDES